jgi:hypothetical protein
MHNAIASSTQHLPQLLATLAAMRRGEWPSSVVQRMGQ